MKRYNKIIRLFKSSLALVFTGAACILLGWKFDIQTAFWLGYLLGIFGTVTYFKFYKVNNI
jgi:hypothetical protein